MNSEPANDQCADLLDLVRKMRSDITWLSIHCVAEQQNAWLRVHMAVAEREIRFLLQIPDGEVIGASGMAARLIEEAERWLLAEGLT